MWNRAMTTLGSRVREGVHCIEGQDRAPRQKPAAKKGFSDYYGVVVDIPTLNRPTPSEAI